MKKEPYDDPEEAAAALHAKCNAACMNGHRYAGVTNQPYRRFSEWGLHPSMKVCLVECAGEESTFDAEEILHANGYEGGGGPGKEGKDPSVFLYAFQFDDRGFFETSWLRAVGLVNNRRWRDSP